MITTTPKRPKGNHFNKLSTRKKGKKKCRNQNMKKKESHCMSIDTNKKQK